MSRIIVKNIPKDITEYDLQEHFSSKGDVTDVKIIKTPNGKSRLFAFIGYKDEGQGKATIKYYNNSYFKTNKIQVEEAKVQGDRQLDKPWSKHTKWSKNEAVKSKIIKETKENKEKEEKEEKLDTKSKIQRLKEIEKVTSAKFKFDVIQGLDNVEGQKKQRKEIKDESNIVEDNAENADLALDEGQEISNKKAKDGKGKGEEDNGDEIEGRKRERNNKGKKPEILNSELEEFDPKRLYLRNLSFQISEEDIENAFNRFGTLSEVSLPRDRHQNSFGYGFVTFETTESSIVAMETMDKKIFQGRILHITPAKVKDIKPSLSLNELTNTQAKNQKTSFKKEKLMKLKSQYDKEVSWNFLFLNHNAVIDAVSKQTGLDKQDLLSKDNAKLAVEVASMETIMINKTKEWLESQGVNLTPFNNKRLNCVRSKTVLLIKNIDSSVEEEELKKLFSRYGELVQFILSPHNVIGIAEFIDSKNAENCFKNLSFYEFNGLPLYLEFSPVGVKLDHKKEAKGEETNTLKEDGAISFEEGNVVFINNLSFETKEEKLKEQFSEYNPVSVKIVLNKTKNNPNLSAGYGFIEFKSSEEADVVLRKMQGTILDSHSLKLSKAKSKANDAEKKQKEVELLANKRKKDTELADIEMNDFETARDDKLLVKNIAFEATKEELRELFKQFGDVKNVRLPQKTSGDHRGYAFVEFLTYEEAKSAFTKLSNTHFYGRKLVIEWAKKDKTVEEIRTETQKKLETMKIVTHRKRDKATIN